MMLRLLFNNQQRSFHQTATRWVYARKTLRRLKKTELIALADEIKMDSTGTKNDLIERILTTSTDPIPSTTRTTFKIDNVEPPLTTRFEKSTITSTPIQPATTSEPEPSNVKPEKSSNAEETPSSSTTSHSHSTSGAAILTDTNEDNDEDYDPQWVEAFDLKVGNRRSGINGLGGRERSSSTQQEYRSKRRSQQQQQQQSATSSTSSNLAPGASSSTHPAYVHQTLGVDPANIPNLNFVSSSPHRPTVDDLKTLETNGERLEFTDPEINQHWVKVFDQRVKTRTKIMGLDTLDVNPNKTSTEQQQQLYHQILPPSQPIKNESTDNSTSSSSTGNNKLIDIAIGTSLATWYFLGGEGIQTAFSSFFS